MRISGYPRLFNPYNNQAVTVMKRVGGKNVNHQADQRHKDMASRVGHKSHILRVPEPRLRVPEPRLRAPEATRSRTTVTRGRNRLRVAKTLATRKINTLRIT